MSPTRDMGRGSPTSRDLRVSLRIEQDSAGVVVARLAVDQQDGRLVELELTGDELALLLAGEAVAVTGETSVVEQPHDDEHVVVEPADAEEPTPTMPATHGTALDEPPQGTEPVARSTDLRPGEAVVAYIRGRWLDAVVIRRDVGSLLVTYSRPGSFGPVQQRIPVDRVRRRT